MWFDAVFFIILQINAFCGKPCKTFQVNSKSPNQYEGLRFVWYLKAKNENKGEGRLVRVLILFFAFEECLF